MERLLSACAGRSASISEIATRVLSRKKSQGPSQVSTVIYAHGICLSILLEECKGTYGLR